MFRCHPGASAARNAETRLAELDLPPFHGVPIAVKDLTETAGVKTTFSSRAFADYVPTADASVVRAEEIVEVAGDSRHRSV